MIYTAFLHPCLYVRAYPANAIKAELSISNLLIRNVARIIYTVFVCVIVAVLGGCWKTYDTESQRNMVM